MEVRLRVLNTGPSRRSLPLEQLAKQQDVSAPLVIVGAGSFSAHHLFELTWTALEEGPQSELIVNGKRYHPQLVQEGSTKLYRVSDSCGCADSRGIIRLKLKLSTTSTIHSKASPASPAVFELALVSLLPTEDFAESPSSPNSPTGLKVEAQYHDSASDKITVKKGRSISSIMKVKGPRPMPKRPRAVTPPSADRDAICVLSPIEEVTEPPTSPFVRSPSSAAPQQLQSHQPVSVKPVPTKQPLKRSQSHPNAPTSAAAESEPKVKRARTLPNAPKPLAEACSRTKNASKSARGQLRSPQQSQGSRQARRASNPARDMVTPQELELEQMQAFVNEHKKALEQVELLGAHYCNTATILLNRLLVVDVCQHLDEQLRNPILDPEERMNVALAKERAMTSKKEVAVTAVRTEVRRMLCCLAGT